MVRFLITGLMVSTANRGSGFELASALQAPKNKQVVRANGSKGLVLKIGSAFMV